MSSSDRGDDDVEEALGQHPVGLQRPALEAQQRDAAHQLDPAVVVEPHELEEAGHDEHLAVPLEAVTDRDRGLGVGGLGVGEDDVLDGQVGQGEREVPDPAQHRDRQVAGRQLRVALDHPDRLEAVLRLAAERRREPQTDLVGAHDDDGVRDPLSSTQRVHRGVDTDPQHHEEGSADPGEHEREAPLGLLAGQRPGGHDGDRRDRGREQVGGDLLEDREGQPGAVQVAGAADPDRGDRGDGHGDRRDGGVDEERGSDDGDDVDGHQEGPQARAELRHPEGAARAPGSVVRPATAGAPRSSQSHLWCCSPVVGPRACRGPGPVPPGPYPRAGAAKRRRFGGWVAPWNNGATVRTSSKKAIRVLEVRAQTRLHRPRDHPELLHHRAHRPRQVDPRGPDAPADRCRRRAGRPRPVPRPHGHRARARHHHQEPGRPDALDRRRRQRAGCRAGHLRAQHDRHPGPRRLHLRGLPLARGVRGRGPARRRRAGHRGADPGQPLPRPRRQPPHHPGAEQDRPALRPAREVRRGARRHHRLRPLRRADDLGQDRPRRRGAAQRDRQADAGPAGRRRRPAARADLRLRLRHLPRRRHLRPGRRRQAQPPRPDQDDVDRRRPRDARGRRDQPRAGEGLRDRRRRGRLPDHRGEGRPPVAGR